MLALDYKGGYLNYGASLMHHRFRDIEDLFEQSVVMSEQKSKKTASGVSASVDVDDSAGNEACSRAREKRDDGGNFLRLAVAAECQHATYYIRDRAIGRIHLGLDWPREDYVRGDAS